MMTGSRGIWAVVLVGALASLALSQRIGEPAGGGGILDLGQGFGGGAEFDDGLGGWSGIGGLGGTGLGGAGIGPGGRGIRGGRGGRGAMDLTYDRRGVPDWPVDPQFKEAAFTFVRIRYSSWGGVRGGGWSVDYPDSDLNFSFRLQQMTSLKVNPTPIVLDLTDERLFDYPFIYMLEIGGIVLSDDEVVALRRYLLNGGFLMVDDHWGVAEYERFYQEIKRVFPDREPVELDLDHPVFHCVFDLKEKPQIPAINVARSGRTTERADAPEAIYRGIFDDKGRMMVIICSNTDLGDGWEREGQDEWYFREFSEKKAYPMGINIVFYMMTH